MQEPWNTLVFLLLIPIIAQFVKVLKEKRGAEFGRNAAQLLALLLSIGVVFISGGLAEVPIPIFPPDLDFSADLGGSITLVLTFAGLLSGYVIAVWAIVMGLYEGILEKLFLLTGFATDGQKRRAAMRVR